MAAALNILRFSQPVLLDLYRATKYESALLLYEIAKIRPEILTRIVKYIFHPCYHASLKPILDDLVPVLVKFMDMRKLEELKTMLNNDVSNDSEPVDIANLILERNTRILEYLFLHFSHHEVKEILKFITTTVIPECNFKPTQLFCNAMQELYPYLILHFYNDDGTIRDNAIRTIKILIQLSPDAYGKPKLDQMPPDDILSLIWEKNHITICYYFQKFICILEITPRLYIRKIHMIYIKFFIIIKIAF